MARYSAGDVEASGDGRLFSPSFARNFEPILDALHPHLEGVRGQVLEIGCGTGQHAAHLAKSFAHLTWVPSDIDAGHRASSAAWGRHLAIANIAEPVHLDASADWAADWKDLAAIFSANVIHISPWRVAKGIVSGAGQALAPGGVLIFYGPFKEDGEHTGEGNARFDAGLRAENPAWGVRDISDLAKLANEAGLGPARITSMPSNNRLVAFRK